MHIIKVCTGCSCDKNFSAESIQKAEHVLDIKVGETTKDGQFRLEKTGCLSHCELGPNVLFCKADGPLSAVMIDGEVKNNMLPHRLEAELKSLKENS